MSRAVKEIAAMAHMALDEVGGLRAALLAALQEKELYRSRWLSCVTHEEADRATERFKEALCEIERCVNAHPDRETQSALGRIKFICRKALT